MIASTPTCDSNRIRMSMGDFKYIRNVAKYAARLAQSFDSSTKTLSVSKHEIEYIPDVELVRNEKKAPYEPNTKVTAATVMRKLKENHGYEYSRKQLFGAPRIYKILNSGEYVRTTDFTPSCIIGQFYGLALELPDNMNLPNFDEISLNYMENEENPLNLEKGNTFFS
ncbi:hypothetical protein RD792_008569 [Penstemon davidsonii]|uniref:RNA-dependent RNA polymerase n=1 Tax=Penstemon davidsonii TaxID=160366 RepID=A0ABR0DB40_9LAMI|nr:hypothetical protein RD792_008569 [Penstemon davidsonii]